eukprot:4499134-Pyramimonas_sp.AAC.1
MPVMTQSSEGRGNIRIVGPNRVREEGIFPSCEPIVCRAGARGGRGVPDGGARAPARVAGSVHGRRLRGGRGGGRQGGHAALRPPD